MATMQTGYSTSGMTTASNNTSGSSSQSSTNFSAGGENALSILIQQLLSGGTAEQKNNRTQRNEEITSVRGIRNDYSKEDAMNDANLVIRQQQRKALEELLPSLVRSAEGAGTSKNAMRALMVQQAATQAAESAAALGLKASVDYGNISANLSGVLENLTKSDNPVTNALISAINLSKGQSSSSTSTSSGGSSGVNSNTGGVNLPRVNHSTEADWGSSGLFAPIKRTPDAPMIGFVGSESSGFGSDSSRANQSTAGFLDSLIF